MIFFFFFFPSVGLVAVVVVVMVGCWLWWWFGFFLFVCEFGYDCGLQLKWWFRNCGYGRCGFGGCGCVATFTIAIATERWERGEHCEMKETLGKRQREER